MTLGFALLFNFIPLITVFICFKLLIKDFKFFPAILACIIGMLAVLPIAVVQFLLDKTNFFTNKSLTSVLINDLVLCGLVEESFKMLLLFFIPSKKQTLGQFFACAVLCGLTLGCFENLIYLIGGTWKIELRLFTSVVIHLCCTGLSGIFVYGIKKKNFLFSPFLWAIVLHGIFNYFAGFKMNTPFFYFSFAVILIAIAECRIFYSLEKSKLVKVAPIENVEPEDEPDSNS